MKSETLFLKLALVLFGVPVLAICIFVVPEIASYTVELFPEAKYLKYLVYLSLYATAIPFYMALYQAYTLLNFIDRNIAFSELSIKALKNIKFCGIIISLLFVVSMPIFYIMAEYDDAPGVIVIGLVFIFASLVVAVFAAVLQKLLQHAIEIKSENDLTV